MVQNMELVRDRHTSLIQIVDRARKVWILHVPSRIVVSANYHNAGMTATRCLHQLVQILEIIMIPGYENEAVQRCMKQMAGVPSSQEPNVGRYGHSVAGFPEPRD
jgi:hypothetical protein